MNTSGSIQIEDRKRAVLGGVTQVLGFDDKELILDTVNGVLKVSGKELLIESFDATSGNLKFVGIVDEIKFKGEKTTFLKKLIK